MSYLQLHRNIDFAVPFILPSYDRNREQRKTVCEIRPTANGKFIQLVPSTTDIFKHINRCARTVIDSAKALSRWMKGTCVETEPQRNINDILGHDHTYTYYEDISTDNNVLKTILQIKYKVKVVFRGIHDFIQ